MSSTHLLDIMACDNVDLPGFPLFICMLQVNKRLEGDEGVVKVMKVWEQG